MVNTILLSTIYYFIAMWSGSIQVIRLIRSNLRNYLWNDIEYTTYTRVNWKDCCLLKAIGGLKLLDPKVSLYTLLAKWILYAIELGISRLKILLHHQNNRMKPHPKGAYWFPLPSWLMVHRPSATHKSQVWN